MVAGGKVVGVPTMCAVRAAFTVARMNEFTVRIWEAARPLPGQEQPILRGVVEHVASGECSVFVGGEYLVAFLTRRCEEPKGA